MTRGRVARSLAVAVLLGTTIAAPTVGQHVLASAPQAKVATLIVGWDVSDAKTLDPGREYEFTGQTVDHALYDSLVTVKNGNVANVLGDLATSWKITSGGTVFTFTLRQGVKFSSGNSVTADDVVFSYKRFQNLHDNPSTLIGGMKDIKALFDPNNIMNPGEVLGVD